MNKLLPKLATTAAVACGRGSGFELWRSNTANPASARVIDGAKSEHSREDP